MSTHPDETEVDLILSNVFSETLAKLPYNSQDPVDTRFAEAFLLRSLASKINPRLDKILDPLKKAINSGALTTDPVNTENYRREISVDTPRSSFDKDAFIEAICEAYPDLLKHKLVEIAATCLKQSKAPIKIEYSYIGHIPKAAE
jgi:hypothetical protein